MNHNLDENVAIFTQNKMDQKLILLTPPPPPGIPFFRYIEVTRGFLCHLDFIVVTNWSWWQFFVKNPCLSFPEDMGGCHFTKRKRETSYLMLRNLNVLARIFALDSLDLYRIQKYPLWRAYSKSFGFVSEFAG